MRNHSARLFGLAAAALVLATGSAAAQGKGHGNDKVKDKGNDKGNDEIHGKGQDGRHDDDVVRVPGSVIIRDGDRVYGNGRKVPPGLAKKPGHMPPGQYKKRYGTREGASVLGGIFNSNGYTVQRITRYGQSQYVYYRTADGRTARAIVSPGADRLQFNNVPASILSLVLAQLY
ncbi:MAG: hypothetical protein H0W68_11515 [Gemmatimonadaceae bacterium]|nr:hypothetical protein [Gemmatimonadaceae bacterium]